MKENKRKWKSYLKIQFPDHLTEEHIQKLKESLQEIFSIKNPGTIVQKIDYMSNTDS